VLVRRVVEPLRLQALCRQDLVIAPSPDGGSPSARFVLVGVGRDDVPTSAGEKAR
jgi:hypothetical protein